jgi:CubicO group peptidase (beta-lactamase class C family)
MSNHPDRITRRAAMACLGAAALLPVRSRADASTGLATVARRAASLEQLHALVVAHRGEIVFAEAFRGPAVDRPVNVKSVSKTVVALLTGVAIARGAVPGVDAPLADFVPPPRGADPRVRAITLEDLVTMRAGLERTSGRGYGPWVESRNWTDHALTRPFVDEPGGRFLYSTGSFHLLGVALARATGRTLLALARDWLGDPLGIEIPAWTRDPQGYYLGGNEMALSPLALIRIGETARLGGAWGGAQVVPARWIEASWTPRTRSPFSNHDYGYGWFLARAGGRRVAYGRGYGGQMLYVAPEFGLTVAVTSDPTRPARSDGHVGDLNALLAEAIIPAVQAAKG